MNPFYLDRTKVEAQLDLAKGGVLFIDEAYELGKGQYGSEACTALVAAMTDPRYAGVIIIIAGYQAEISSMLETNPGLKSRFNHFLEFPDWAPKDCVDGFMKRAEQDKYEVDRGAVVILKEGFERLLGLDGWGNARDVAQVYKSTLQHRADRVVGLPGGLPKSLTQADVSAAVKDLVSARALGFHYKAPMNAQVALPSAVVVAAPGGPLPGPSRPSIAPPTIAKDPVSYIESEPSTAIVQEVREATCEACDEAQVENSLTTQQGDCNRDAGVSDELWAALQQAKEEEGRREAQAIEEEERRAKEREAEILAAHEAEQVLARFSMQTHCKPLADIRPNDLHSRTSPQARIREIREEQQRQEAAQRAKAEYEAKLDAERRLREEAILRRQQELTRQEAIKAKLREISPCPAGFSWTKMGGGWRCGGGSHFVSDAELNARFSS